MRRVVDMLIVMLLVAVLVGLVWHYRHEQADLDDYRKVHEAISKLYEHALFQGSIEEQTTQAGFPLMIQERWFAGNLPINVAVHPDQPWLDIAPLGDNADHPPDPVINTGEQAGFWYNPNRGLFRARVMPGFTDDETLEHYNQLNNTALKHLPRDDKPERQPISMARITAAADQAISDAAEGKYIHPALKRRTLLDVKTRD